MKKLILFLILIFFANNVHAINNQNDIKDSTRQTKNIKEGNSESQGICITLTQGISYDRNDNDANLHYINFDFGYKINNKHEIGLSFGDNNLLWYGFYYRIYFEDAINLGLKIAKNDGFNYLVYTEFTVGNTYKITNNFNFRTDLFYGIYSKYPLGIINNRHNKFGILIGLNYLF
jgi:hypothetical protein